MTVELCKERDSKSGKLLHVCSNVQSILRYMHWAFIAIIELIHTPHSCTSTILPSNKHQERVDILISTAYHCHSLSRNRIYKWNHCHESFAHSSLEVWNKFIGLNCLFSLFRYTALYAVQLYSRAVFAARPLIFPVSTQSRSVFHTLSTFSPPILSHNSVIRLIR